MGYHRRVRPDGFVRPAPLGLRHDLGNGEDPAGVFFGLRGQHGHRIVIQGDRPVSLAAPIPIFSDAVFK